MVRVGLIELVAFFNCTVGYWLLNWLVWPNADLLLLILEQFDVIVVWVADGGYLFVIVSDIYW